MEELELTPERLLDEGVLAPVDLHFARAAGRLAGDTAPLVLLAAALASRAPRHGHVCLDLGALSTSVRLEPGEDGTPPAQLRWPEPGAWASALAKSPLVDSGQGGPAPLVLRGRQLYLERFFQRQQELVQQLRDRAVDLAPADGAALSAGLSRHFVASHEGPDLQMLAALVAVLRRLTVITGGPGTGKTHTLVRVLALLVEQAEAAGEAAPRILLMAPTGKAAARMKEAVARAKGGRHKLALSPALLQRIPEEASTLHRGLGWQAGFPPRFRHHRDNPLPADVVVVDEASMVPLTMMACLLQAVPPGARLVLLGDRDQLTSVEAGAVLGDICGDPARGTRLSAGFAARVERHFGPLPTGLASAHDEPAISDCVVHLTRARRFQIDSGIRAAAGAVIAGDAARALDLLRGNASQRADGAPHDDLALLELSEPGGLERVLRERVVQVYRPLVASQDPAAALAALGAFRVLCAHRRGPLGSLDLNLQIQRWLARGGYIQPDGQQYAGRPLLVTENEYALDLFNGDDGVVLPSPADGGELRAFFAGPGGNLRSLHPARLPAHETVFAMTIHKSQGSEWDEVVVVLPHRPSPVLTRELLYTALTRAKKRVTVVGSEAVLAAGIAERVSRASGVREGVWG